MLKWHNYLVLSILSFFLSILFSCFTFTILNEEGGYSINGNFVMKDDINPIFPTIAYLFLIFTFIFLFKLLFKDKGKEFLMYFIGLFILIFNLSIIFNIFKFTSWGMFFLSFILLFVPIIFFTKSISLSCDNNKNNNIIINLNFLSILVTVLVAFLCILFIVTFSGVH